VFLGSKIFWCGGLVAFLATGVSASAASTNPWALPQQQTQPQTNMQGGFNMGGGFSFGGGSGQSWSNQVMPQFVAPQPFVPQQQVVPQQQPQPQQVIPQQPLQQQPMPRQTAPVAPGQQFGVYPPLSNNNSATSLGRQNRYAQPGRGYGPAQPYGYGNRPYGYGNNPGYFGFPGFGGLGNFGMGMGFGGGFGSGFGNGFGNGFVAPAPSFPGYGYPYYQGQRGPQYQPQQRGRTN